MSIIVQTIARWLKGFIFVFGIYLAFYGHLTPGGGFSGGVVIATTFVLLTLAFGKERALSKLGKMLASFLDCSGALLFLLIAALGVLFGGAFFTNFLEKQFPSANFRLFSAGVLPLCNISIAMKVGASLFMIFIIIAVRRVIEVDGRRRLISTEFFDTPEKGSKKR
ncbi:MAG: cation:proton antiporter [Candidatus Omnitrophica bacterium]|nr:cation:proton antiporter [Candidatus Omnitrophota bacterium]MCM8788822.1 cation:proton antiporter [Candidatus Omnitrophota bacterium]